MPPKILKFKPGVDTESTPVLSELSWNTSQLIRFRSGLPEKIGGWAHLNAEPLVGTGRGMHAWADLNGLPYVAVGTEQRLEIFNGGLMQDITPLRATTNVAPDFSTVSGSPLVTVQDVANGTSAGDWVNIVVTVSVGGLLLEGFYRVVNVLDANNYQIQADSLAATTVSHGGAVPVFTTLASDPKVSVALANHGQAIGSLFPVQVSTTIAGITMFGSYSVIAVIDANTLSISPGPIASGPATVGENGGNARVRYLMASGFASATPLTGYGIGDYGAGDYGLSGSGGGGTDSDVAPLRQWFLNNWGQDLIGNYTGSTLFYWAPPVAADNVAMPTGGTTPAAINVSFISMPAQIAVALGCETGGIFDPNLIRWCDVANFSDWVATALNQAGSFRLPTGSRIVGGIQGPQFAFIWTDIDCWIMQYIQPPLVFGFNKVAGGTSLIAARAAAIYQSTVYWLAPDNFCTFDGNSVQIIPCTVWDAFFYDLNKQQIDKVFCGVNSLFTEVMWFYPSASSDEVDSYVKYNINEKAWDFGKLGRTCWEDKNVLGPPIGVDPQGYLQQHEVGYDADGAPMNASIQSGALMLSEGDAFTYVQRLIGDFQLEGGTAPLDRVLVSLIFQDYPDDEGTVSGPYEWSASGGPNYSIVQGRGRQVSVLIESTDPGVAWRLGGVRIVIAPAGKR